VFFSIQPW